MGNLPYYSCNINHWSVFWLWIDEIRWCHHVKLPGKIIVYYNASVTKLVDKQDTCFYGNCLYSMDHVYRILFRSESKLPFWSGKWLGTVGRCK